MIRVLVLSLALAGAACTQSNPPQPPEETVSEGPQTAQEATAQDTCGASEYRSLIGANIAAVTLPADANIRVITPGTMVTEDFRPDRLNIIAGEDGVITSLECY